MDEAAGDDVWSDGDAHEKEDDVLGDNDDTNVVAREVTKQRPIRL